MLSLVILTLLGSSHLSTALPTSSALSYDDVIVIKNDGQPEIMKAADFDRLEHRAAAFSPPSGTKDSNPVSLQPRRGCDKSTEIQVLSDTEFLNWDVPISPVVSSAGGQSASVAVSSGYTLSNTLTAGASLDIPLIKNLLSASLSVSYTETWTTQQSHTLTFNVPENMFGVIVSQPYVRRVQGNVFSGCTDNPSNNTFMSDTYTSQAYKDLNWVKGVIRLCSSDKYPIPYCIGEGTHA
ncbi:uncharacterized protein E0L32_005932 [Thyridium curvatum]|uniref:Celp0028 effector like protein n=1 Tax=Thyridium curvatum TaxID=1093900 RepID=A0A507B8L7_9PEZI|nr:uncharacterized protein E0L32_005932 [Thyridium curvatum]TPX13729.1 hypothetical protein E0L32_005932 [Thyridium curvatum]